MLLRHYSEDRVRKEHDHDHNENVKKQLVPWAQQQFYRCSTIFSTFLWRPLHDYDVKVPKCDVSWGTRTYDERISLSAFLHLEKVLKNSISGEIAFIWKIGRVEIDAIKFEGMQIIFFS